MRWADMHLNATALIADLASLCNQGGRNRSPTSESLGFSQGKSTRAMAFVRELAESFRQL
jgi:hypothetical protein